MNSVHMNRESKFNNVGWGGVANKGSILMKTVSILLVNSRRVCNQKKCVKDRSDGKPGRKRMRSKKMEEGAGKPNPKFLELMKKRTHFSK